MLEALTQFEADGITPVYFRTARDHEVVFRGVLAHIKSASIYVPADLDVAAPIEDLLERCSPGQTYGQFNVFDFLVGPREDSPLSRDVTDREALIAFGDIATLSGGGAICRYELAEDEPPVFSGTVSTMMS